MGAPSIRSNGSDLKRLRSIRRMTMDQACEFVGRGSRHSWAAWEKGEPMREDIAYLIAEKFGVRPSVISPDLADSTAGMVADPLASYGASDAARKADQNKHKKTRFFVCFVSVHRVYY